MLAAGPRNRGPHPQPGGGPPRARPRRTHPRVARHARLQEGWDGSAGDPGEDVAVDLAGLFQVQEMAGTADDDHARGWGEEGPGAAVRFAGCRSDSLTRERCSPG